LEKPQRQAQKYGTAPFSPQHKTKKAVSFGKWQIGVGVGKKKKLVAIPKGGEKAVWVVCAKAVPIPPQKGTGKGKRKNPSLKRGKTRETKVAGITKGEKKGFIKVFERT